MVNAYGNGRPVGRSGDRRERIARTCSVQPQDDYALRLPALSPGRRAEWRLTRVPGRGSSEEARKPADDQCLNEDILYSCSSHHQSTERRRHRRAKRSVASPAQLVARLCPALLCLFKSSAIDSHTESDFGEYRPFRTAFLWCKSGFHLSSHVKLRPW